MSDWFTELRGVQQMKDDGASLPRRPRLAFVSGTGISVQLTDDPDNAQTNVTVSATGGGGGSGGILQVDSRTALGTLPTAALDDGALCFVGTLDNANTPGPLAFYRFTATAYRAGDGVLAIDGFDGGVWELVQEIAHPYWLTRDEWYINPSTGSDSNVGSATHPIASVGELLRRLGPCPTITQRTFVHQLGHLDASDDDVVRIRGVLQGDGDFRWLGTVVGAAVVTGTLASIAHNPASNNEPWVVTSGAVADWAPHVGARIRVTSGAAAGAIAWVAKAISGGAAARVSEFRLYSHDSGQPIEATGAILAPSASDSFVIETLPRLKGLQLDFDADNATASTQTLVLVSDVDCRGSGTHQDYVRAGGNPGRAVIARSRVDIRSFSGLGGRTAFVASQLVLPTSLGTISQCKLELLSCLVRCTGAVAFFTLDNDVQLDTAVAAEGTLVLQNAVLLLNSPQHIRTDIAVYDSVLAGGYGAVNVGANGDGIPCDVLHRGLLYGKDNAGVGICLAGRSTWGYEQEPIIATTGTVGRANGVNIAALPAAESAVTGVVPIYPWAV